MLQLINFLIYSLYNKNRLWNHNCSIVGYSFFIYNQCENWFSLSFMVRCWIHVAYRIAKINFNKVIFTQCSKQFIWPNDFEPIFNGKLLKKLIINLIPFKWSNIFLKTLQVSFLLRHYTNIQKGILFLLYQHFGIHVTLKIYKRFFLFVFSLSSSSSKT